MQHQFNFPCIQRCSCMCSVRQNSKLWCWIGSFILDESSTSHWIEISWKKVSLIGSTGEISAIRMLKISYVIDPTDKYSLPAIGSVLVGSKILRWISKQLSSVYIVLLFCNELVNLVTTSRFHPRGPTELITSMNPPSSWSSNRKNYYQYTSSSTAIKISIFPQEENVKASNSHLIHIIEWPE